MLGILSKKTILIVGIFFLFATVIIISQDKSLLEKPPVGKNLPPRLPEQIKQKPPMTMVFNSIVGNNFDFEISNINSPGFNENLIIEYIFPEGKPPEPLQNGHSIIMKATTSPQVIKISNANPASSNEAILKFENLGTGTDMVSRIIW